VIITVYIVIGWRFFGLAVKQWKGGGGHYCLAQAFAYSAKRRAYRNVYFSYDYLSVN